MPVYSFGVDSPLKFELTEDYAKAYNGALKAFFLAQEIYELANGTRWEPKQTLWITWTEEQREAFNGFAKILSEALKLYGKPVHESELTDDYLIKN